MLSHLLVRKLRLVGLRLCSWEAAELGSELGFPLPKVESSVFPDSFLGPSEASLELNSTISDSKDSSSQEIQRESLELMT